MTSPRSVDVQGLPKNPQDSTKPVGWWGMWLFIASEAMLFAAWISSYFFVRFGSEEWPLGGIEPPELLLPAIGTVILLSSSATAHWAERGLDAGDIRRLRVGLTSTIGLGLAFLGIQTVEYARATFTPQTNAYGSLFFGITGFHGLHVLVGVALLLAVAIAGRAERPVKHGLQVRVSIMYWHFVDVIWIFVLSSLYLAERL